MMNPLTANTWRILLYSILHRRQYIPILSIYFLTLPSATAQQIGLYIAAGALASVLFEVPSGYLADRWGHKKTLILAKVFMIASTTIFIFSQEIMLFSLGSIFLALGFAFSSGTKEAFMHNNLEALGREKEYTKVMSKIGANASLISMFFIITLPFFTQISMKLPLQINLVLDIIGFFVALTLVNPPEKGRVIIESFIKTLRSITRKGFYPFIFLVSAITGFLAANHGYQYVHLTNLGYPIIFIGFVMGLSRLLWFVFGHYAHVLEEKVSTKNILRFEIIFFPILFLLIAVGTNPYLVGGLFSLAVGYKWGRSQIITNHLFTHYLKNKKFKATAVSMMSLLSNGYAVVVAFVISFFMNYSYKMGYTVFSILMFVVLLFTFLNWKKYEK